MIFDRQGYESASGFLKTRIQEDRKQCKGDIFLMDYSESRFRTMEGVQVKTQIQITDLSKSNIYTQITHFAAFQNQMAHLFRDGVCVLRMQNPDVTSSFLSAEQKLSDFNCSHTVIQRACARARTIQLAPLTPQFHHSSLL